MKHRHLVVLAVSAALLISLLVASLAVAQVSLPGGIYTENFNTLANTGTSSAVPPGWAFSESGSNANTTYSAGTGSGTTGDTYSFGPVSSTDRAFGGLQSGALVPTIGVQFTNNTSGAIGRLVISYNCEQWRLGTVGRTDRMDFQYSTNAISLTTGTWTDVDVLDCPTTNTTTPGAHDGNVVSTTISSTVMLPSSIGVGSNFWLRWNSFDASGADDGLAVDNFSMSLLSPNAITLLEIKATPSSSPIAWLVLTASIALLCGVFIIVHRRSRAA